MIGDVSVYKKKVEAVKKDPKDTYEQALTLLKKAGHFVYEQVRERVRTGIVGFDWLLGGGLPSGKIVEVYGFEHSGKSTFAAEAAKAVQAIGKRVLYIDFEHAVDYTYFKRIGVDMENDKLWLFDQPFCLEDGMQVAIDLVSTGEIGLLIVDSVAAMTPKAELEGEMADQQIGLQARLMGKALRKLTGLLNTRNTIALFINQQRDRIGPDARWNPTTQPGGRALKFFASVRIELKRIGKSEEEQQGSRHRALLKKQKCAVNQRGVVEFEIGPAGIDRLKHLKQCLLTTGTVENRAGSYFFGDKKLARGDLEFENFLAEKDKSAYLVDALMKKWVPDTTFDVEEE